LTGVPTPGPTPCSCQLEHIIIISIDGLRPDALRLADTPNLDALIAAGAYSDKAQAVLPSVTLVNHASMLGGMEPAKHGITWNVENPELGQINGPTLFSLAHEAGLRTAMVVGKPKLDHLVLPNSVDDYNYAGYLDQQVIKQAIALIETDLPDLLFIHLPDVDSAGHLTGWMSPGQLQTISLSDGLIGQLMATLKARAYLDSTLLIITADHGGNGLAHGSDSPEDTTIPWLAVGPGVRAGLKIESDIVIYDTAATALHALQLPIPEIWDGQPVLEIFE
jgi:predicted AlkP superfamily pyrophosphatase or phosphodiesterase